MKLHELYRLNEETHTIQGDIDELDQLRGKDGEYLVGTVDVTGHVSLYDMYLEQLPVRFGTVGTWFDCSQNRLTSLEGAPSAVGGNFYCHTNRLTSLEGVHRILRQIDMRLDITRNKFTSGGIGLLLVKGLEEINADQPAFGIINEFLGQGKKGLLRCQEVLHETGLEEFARL